MLLSELQSEQDSYSYDDDWNDQLLDVMLISCFSLADDHDQQDHRWAYFLHYFGETRLVLNFSRLKNDTFEST